MNLNNEARLVDEIGKLRKEVERLKRVERIDSSLYSLTTHDHNADYLGISAKAADSDKLDGLDSTDFGRPVFLTTPLTSTSWDGDAFSTTSKTLIDLSSVFSVPAGAKAVLASVSLRDSGSAGSTTGCYFILSPNDNNYEGIYTYCAGLANDAWTHHNAIVPCDSNGDIYYQINASGSGTMDIYLEIWGYFL